MRRYGFNLLWMFAPEARPQPQAADEKVLDFMAAEGFDFARFPLHYHYWSRPGDYALPDEATADLIDGYVRGCLSRGIHVCLNLHQAPGYAVSSKRQALEPHNLWTDAAAEEALVRYWEWFAQRYRGISPELLSFNPLNEPPAVGRHGLTRERHATVLRRVAAAIRAIDPARPLIIDGIDYGQAPAPELADLGAVQSARGYQPMALTHYGAEWEEAFKTLPLPTWPGLRYEGRVWDRETLREYYRPWRELEARGVAVHVGEFGCYRKTPQEVALAWFRDLLTLFREFGWGWALWNFAGPFGIVEHGRPGARYELRRGFRVDRDLLELIRPPRSVP